MTDTHVLDATTRWLINEVDDGRLEWCDAQDASPNDKLRVLLNLRKSRMRFAPSVHPLRTLPGFSWLMVAARASGYPQEQLDQAEAAYRISVSGDVAETGVLACMVVLGVRDTVPV